VIKTIIFIVSILIYANSFAQIKPNKTVLEKRNWEVWQDRIPISGGVRIGLMLSESMLKVNPSSFYVYVPNTEIKTVCVELSSKDGRYSARIDYSIDKLNKGVHQFLLPTKYKKELSSYKANEIVILASLNENCNENPKAYLISNWNNLNTKKNVFVYINSQIPAKLVLDSVEFDCDDLESPTIAFNKKCKIPLDSLKETSLVYIKQRTRRMGRVKFNSYELPIKSPQIEN